MNGSAVMDVMWCAVSGEETGDDVGEQRPHKRQRGNNSKLVTRVRSQPAPSMLRLPLLC